MYNKNTYNKRNKLIYEAYCKLWGNGLRDELIYPRLNEQFHLQPKTLRYIVRTMIKQSQAAQPEIPFKNENEV